MGWISIVPVALAVILAFTTRNTIVSLATACIVGCFFAGKGIFGFTDLLKASLGNEDLEKQAEAIRVEQIKLYESYADGVLLRDAYIEKKKILSEKLAALQDSIQIEKEEQECADELDEEIRALTKQASEKTYIGGLTKECVDAFVSMVYLYDDQTMKIEFNCEDVIRRALEKYGA